MIYLLREKTTFQETDDENTDGDRNVAGNPRLYIQTVGCLKILLLFIIIVTNCVQRIFLMSNVLRKCH